MGYRGIGIIGIYTITNTVNGLKYVGGTVNIERRWNAHQNMLKRGVHKSIYLQQDYDKYGKDAFIYSVIEIVTDKDKLLEREQFYYDIYEPYKRENGYNVNLNAKDSTGKKMRPETIKRMKEQLSIALKGVNKGMLNGNSKYSDETIKQAFDMLFEAKNSKYICKELSISKSTLKNLYHGHNRKYIYEEYAVPRIKAGERMVLK